MNARTLAQLTIVEVAEQLERSPRVLVPVGSTEQHGSHAPLGTDAILATAVCDRVAPRVDALVAPAIPFGVSPEHEGFPGLVTLSPRTMSSLVHDVCVSLARGGFRKIALVNGHYTNVVALHAAVMEASDDLPDGTALYWLSYWDALPQEQRDAYLGDEAGLHANIGETSAVMAVDESLVHLERARPEYPQFERPLGNAAVVAYFFSSRGALRRVLPGGVWGDPRESTAERRREYFAQIEDAVVQAIHDAGGPSPDLRYGRMSTGGALVGVDSGGTFTDLVAPRRRDGRDAVVKVPSTPGRPIDAVRGRCRAVGRRSAASPGSCTGRPWPRTRSSSAAAPASACSRPRASRTCP